MALPALTLLALTASGHVAGRGWCYALVLVRGSVNAIDNPARQAFVVEMVGADRVVNAVALNSVIVHTLAHRRPGARRRGDRAARRRRRASLINALSFVAMLVALRLMDPGAAAHARRPPRASRGELRAALALRARARPSCWIPLAMMAAGRHALLQLPGPAAAAGALHLARHGDDLRAADRRDGRRLGGRRARRRRARARRRRGCSSAPRSAFGVAELLAAVAPTLPLQIARARAARRGQRDLRGRRELVAAARRRARACAGA